MTTEYDNIDNIGTTHEFFRDNAEKRMKEYYHKQEVSTVKKLLKKLEIYKCESMIDLGCSVGTWYNDFRKMKFQKIIGIDISEERARTAKNKGYDEIHVCNAYDLPFDDNTQFCVISNDVLIHVLQDEDIIKILNEVYRVLKNNGIFIFNFANEKGLTKKDKKMEYCKFRTKEGFEEMIKMSNFKCEYIIPSYFAIPRIVAHPKIVVLATKIIYPFLDKILQILNRSEYAKVIYFSLKK